MAKKNESNSSAHDRFRRRFDRRGPKNDFHWDAVDDQAQEDMIEPIVPSKRKAARAAHRRDHEVGTLYVSNEESIDAVKKRRVKAAPKAEDYASFVAEIDEGEIDPFAVPSYGETSLTHDDEEYIKDLVSEDDAPETPKRAPKKRAKRESENREPAKRDAQKREPTKKTREKDENPESLDSPEKNDSPKAKDAPEANDAPVEKKRPKRAERKKVEPKGEKPVEKKEPERVVEEPAASNRVEKKTSFFSKIKRAVSSTVATAALDDQQDAKLSEEQLTALALNAKKVLDAVGAESKAPLEKKELSQIELLANVVQNLLHVNLELVSRLNAVEAKSAEVPKEPEEAPKPVVKERRAKRETAQSSAPASALEDANSADDDKKPAPKKRVKRDANQVEARVEPQKSDFDDPISYWENIEDDEPVDALPAPEAKKKLSRAETPDAVEPLPVKNKRRAAKSEVASTPDDDERPDSNPLEKFGELNLKAPTLKALQAMGYSEPTPIQAGAIPTVQTGVDLMGQAKTGTGKTAAFMIPIVEGVADCEPGDSPLALVVVPTRELAVQVRDEAVRIAKCYDISFAACYGGRPLASQVEKLRSGVDILVGTPGRILDLSSRGALSLARVKWVVLDEADRMLDIGFRPDVERILRLTPKSRQTLLFSATLAPPVVSLAKSYMKDPVQVDFSQKDVSADTIEQFYVTVDQDRKFDALVRLLEVQDPRQAIVFCRTKRCVDRLTRKLAEKFDSVEAIHGDLAQTKRDHIMRDFRAEKIRIMVATDVVGRGIDVSTVSHIVNYDIPQYCDDYVHRVGRAGRMGREGVAFTLVTAEEGSELTRIEIRINRLLERYDVPGFEALTRHAQTDDEEKVERKPVFGKAVRRERRAL